MSDPHQPHLGVRVLVPQAIGRGNGILAEGVASAANVDGDDLPMVVRLDKTANVPLIYLFPDASRLFTGAGCHAHLVAYYGRALLRSKLYDIRRLQDKNRPIPP